MIQLKHHDFRPLEDFKYLHHWTNPRWNVLPESDLAQIHLLKEEKSSALWEYEYVYFNELYRYVYADISSPITSSALFDWIRHIDCSHEKTGDVRQDLMTLVPQNDQMVIIIWEPQLAVAVPWHIFYTHWDDFCYPHEEAIYVLPLTEEWYLEHHHEDQLIFGKPRLPLLDETSRRPPVVQERPLIHRDEVLRLLKANEKISAMKLYHRETGIPYKETIDAINKLLEDLQQSSDQA